MTRNCLKLKKLKLVTFSLALYLSLALPFPIQLIDHLSSLFSALLL